MIFEAAQKKTSSLIAQHTHTTPTVILGLSGGPDSVFLYHVLRQLHEQKILHLIAAHLDHGWRANSADDALFCKNLCTEHAITFVSAQAKEFSPTKKYNGSLEEHGRIMRRLFFEQTLQQHNAHFIALAHHLDDQEETFFIRLIRGTTLQGLHGMDPVDGIYIRPLLDYKKTEILKYLEQHKLAYVIDPSNESEKFLRNSIRKNVIPALRSCDNRFDENFSHSVAMLKAEDAFLAKLTQQTFDQIFVLNQETKHHVGNLQLFKQQDAVLQQRIVLAWLIHARAPLTPSSNLVAEILRFLSNPHGGSHRIGTTVTLHKKQQSFWIEL